MASLDNKIAALEAEIEGYKLEYKDATSPKEKSELRDLIKSCRDNLTRLLDEKKAQSAGNPICFYQSSPPLIPIV